MITARWRLAALLATGLLAAGAACTDLPSDPKTPFALEFVNPASPSVIFGDTLRDSLGFVAPLRAIAYNIDGDTIRDAAVSFAVVPVKVDSSGTKIDSTPARIVGGALVVADTHHVYATRTFRVYAQTGGIQAVPVPLTVTRRPDTLLVIGDSVLTMTLSFRDTLPLSPAINVRLRHTPVGAEAAGDTTVPAYLVGYRIVLPASAATDTSYVSLSNGSRVSRWDTTDAGGTASRQVRVHLFRYPFTKAPKAGTDTVYDSVRVEARAYRPRGALVPGSPRQFLLIIKGLHQSAP